MLDTHGLFFTLHFSKNQNLRLRLHSFLSGKDESGQILSNVEKTQCAIVLLHSLPCARHAVLEQLCDVFHEAVQKYVLEFERQALSGESFFSIPPQAPLRRSVHPNYCYFCFCW